MLHALSSNTMVWSKNLCYKPFASVKTVDVLYEQWSSTIELLHGLSGQSDYTALNTHGALGTDTDHDFKPFIRDKIAGWWYCFAPMDPSQLRVLMGCNKFRQLVFCLKKIKWVCNCARAPHKCLNLQLRAILK